MENLAILAASRKLPADSNHVRCSLTQIASQVAVMLFAVGRRHQHTDVSTNHLGGAVTEDPFGGDVVTPDYPGFVYLDIGVIDVVQNAEESILHGCDTLHRAYSGTKQLGN